MTYQLLCWKTLYADGTKRRVKSAGNCDFTEDSNYNPTDFEIYEPGKKAKLDKWLKEEEITLQDNYVYWDTSAETGSHNGSNNASVLTDTSQSWTVNEWVGSFIYNTTDGSYAKITANTATTITANLKGGTDNDWDTSDAYVIREYVKGIAIVKVSPQIEQYLDDNQIWTDTETGLKGPPVALTAFRAERELYNTGPVLVNGFNPVVTRVGNLDTIHGKLGWHNQQVFEAQYYRPKDLLIYYGYLNSFRSSVHSWDNEEIAKDLAHYELLVVGNGLVKLFDSGDHDGSDNASVLTDSSKSWTTNQWVNYRIYNTTDGSSGNITANTGTTITATLAGGTDNDWDTNDEYEIRHGDYANTSIIIPRLKALKPAMKIFGYVDGTLSQSNFETAVDEWDDAGIHGIFIDQAGYDYGTTTTNSRTAMNAKIDYVHDDTTNANLVFANAWNQDHLLGTENDTSYPNTTWNSGLVAGSLSANDWYLLESFPINTTVYTTTSGYESKSSWSARGVKAIGHRATYGVNTAACGIINDNNANGQDLFDFGFTSAMMFSLEAFGTSDTAYGASTANSKFWDRPDTKKLGIIKWINPSVQVDLGDSDVYWRYCQFGRFKLDFSSSAEDSVIEKW